MDSTLCAFVIPQVKKKKCADLHESILKGRSVSVKTLQRFAGKITSFSIAVPSDQLMYARETYRAMSGYSKSSRLVKITGTLRKELEYWRLEFSTGGEIASLGLVRAILSPKFY